MLWERALIGRFVSPAAAQPRTVVLALSSISAGRAACCSRSAMGRPSVATMYDSADNKARYAAYTKLQATATGTPTWQIARHRPVA